MGRHIVNGGEAAVVHLLHTTDLVELGELDGGGIVEIGNAGIVEGDVAVLADADQTDVNGFLADLFGQLCDAFSSAVDKVNSLQGADLVHKALLQVLAEAGHVGDGQTNVLVQMEHLNAVPLNAGFLCQGTDGIELGSAGGQGDSCITLFGDAVLDNLCGVSGSALAQSDFVGTNSDFHSVNPLEFK